MLTILNVLLKSAVAWNVIDRCPARSGLRVLRGSAAFLDFDEYERLVEAARRDGHAAHLIALLGGEGGLRCGESWREWGDVDLTKRQLCVARSEWKGHVTRRLQIASHRSHSAKAAPPRATLPPLGAFDIEATVP